MAFMIPVSVWHTFALPRVTFLVGGKQYGRVGWRVSESPIITYVYRLTGVPSTGGSAIVYTNSTAKQYCIFQFRINVLMIAVIGTD